MNQQKFVPYNQMNEVYEEQEYQQEDSQPLIQQVDPNYEPTQKQVREYAIEALGMKLPEDERLLYLAREGLKAPIPQNWQPFQGRDGQVYYKHKITQQKTYEHPTDVEYRKKYIEEKQRAARKNLKSMNLKSNPLAGLGQPSFGGLGSKLGINPLGLSNLSSEEHQNFSKQVSKLDPKIQENLRYELDQLQQRLQRQYEQFKEERKLTHEKNMKKYKTDFENSLSELKMDKSTASTYQKSIKEQKQRIKERLKQAYNDRFKDQFVEVEKQEEKKYNQFVELYEEDNKIKIKKYESEKQKQFSQRLKKIETLQKNHQANKREKVQQRQNILIQVRQNYEQQDNQEIQKATKQTFIKEINKIKDSHQQKLRQFEQKLDNEYQEMRKILGHDPNKLLQEMAEKKSRLKKISEQKLESMKKKQFQKINQEFSQKLQRFIKQAQNQLSNQNQRQLQTVKSQAQKRLQKMKSNFDNEMKQKTDRKIEQIYLQAKRSSAQYQKQKNKKILEIREQFISQIVSKNDSKNEELEIRLGMREKEQMIENKEELVRSLARQVELEAMVLRQLRMNKAIATSANMDAELKRLIAQLNIVYKPEQFLRHEKIFNSLKQKYKQDKQLLGSMMSQLQNSAYSPFYNRRNIDDPFNNVNSTCTTAILTKQYNKDVRTMRTNYEMLNRYETVLRRAQINDQQALTELQNTKFEYEEISLRANNQFDYFNDPNQEQLREINSSQLQQQQPSQMIIKNYYPQTTTGYQSVQEKLQHHSKFLSNVKAELNRKLYKVRNNNYFRV